MKLSNITLICYVTFLGFLLLVMARKHVKNIDAEETMPLPDVPAVTDIPSAGNAISPADTSASKSECECAVFNSEVPAETDRPIITQSPIDINCNSFGEEHCLKLCAALAKEYEEQGPALLCASVGHYNQLKASVHGRVRGSNKWTYTGLTSPTAFCCHENKVVACEDQLWN